MRERQREDKVGKIHVSLTENGNLLSCQGGNPRMKTMITALKLCKKYGKFKAVDRISFEINEGECFGFLGPNGAGKTSTVRMIHCVSPLSGGSLTVDGMAAGVDNRAIKKMTGVIPQEITLDNDLTVRENLEVFSHFFDIPGAEAGKRIASLLAFVELEKWRDSRIDQLSTGMKRRLLIARALINQPKIIIARRADHRPRPAGAASDLDSGCGS